MPGAYFSYFERGKILEKKAQSFKVYQKIFACRRNRLTRLNQINYFRCNKISLISQISHFNEDELAVAAKLKYSLLLLKSSKISLNSLKIPQNFFKDFLLLKILK